MRNDKFELVRYGLKKYNLIADGPSLEERQCEVEWGKGNCYNCMATHICAKRVRSNTFILFSLPFYIYLLLFTLHLTSISFHVLISSLIPNLNFPD